MRSLRATAVSLLCISLIHNAVSEKGDTYSAVMSGSGLPPGSQWVPPTGKLANKEVHLLLADNGVTANQTLKVTFEVDFPDNKYPWESIALVTTTQPEAPIFFYMANYTPPNDFFVFGNFSYGELSDGMIAGGVCNNIVANAWCVDYTTIQNNSTYAIAILDAANKTAVGGVLKYMPISVYGNGSIGDTAGTTSDLQSEIIYVGSMDSDTISFPMGWESGYQPASNGSGVVLFQYLTDDSYLWEVSIENMKNPKSFELRYFESLSSQPLITVLEPDTPYPVLPNKLKSSDTISGNITTKQLSEAVYRATGLDWATNNFNNTPNVFMTVLTLVDNSSILGFVYNANEAPPPRPVIKGGAGTVEAQNSNFTEVPYIIAAWVVFLFMILNLAYYSSAYRAQLYAARRAEVDKQLAAAQLGTKEPLLAS